MIGRHRTAMSGLQFTPHVTVGLPGLGLSLGESGGCFTQWVGCTPSSANSPNNACVLSWPKPYCARVTAPPPTSLGPNGTIDFFVDTNCGLDLQNLV